MSSNRRRNSNSSRRTNSNDPGETSAHPTETTITLDEFKKNYKTWKTLMNSTGISIDTSTSTIHASDAWWTERETGCK
ncbi:unnamed protein product [Cochlearia groenlandica]